jgi:diaminopimelate decarboxylase
MAEKTVPFTQDFIAQLIRRYPTPFHLYDEKAMRANARRLAKAFGRLNGYREYFAVKACPNPHILRILKAEGFGVDCSSMAELVMAERCGFRGAEIFFSSNDTPAEEYRKATELGAVINLDDISHIPFLEAHAGLPDLLSVRFNPGPERTGNAIIGNPVEAKYGFTRAQIFEGIGILKAKGVRRFGLHTMVVSNELNPQSYVETALMMFGLAAEVKARVGVDVELVNLGGGIGIPYKPDQEAVDLEWVARQTQEAYERTIVGAGLSPLKIVTECGRLITGPYGYLVSTVLHKKDIYKQYVGLDACMANLMRPALYGAYHHITVLGKENAPATHRYDVTGSLCENNDKFAVDRPLPEIAVGDVVVIHDAGAHGYAMGFNYNGKLRSAELLLQENGEVRQIRRAETLEDYFATLEF